MDVASQIVDIASEAAVLAFDGVSLSSFDKQHSLHFGLVLGVASGASAVAVAAKIHVPLAMMEIKAAKS